MGFIGNDDVQVKQLDAKNWQLLAPLKYKGKQQTFTVPKGMKTDFASVPRPFIWFIPRYGIYTKAAIFHDYLWREQAAKGKLSWADADGLFRRAMRDLGTAFLRRWITWSAVRCASILTKAGGRRGWTDDLLPALLFALIGFVFVAGPGVLIIAVLAVFWLLERLVWLVLKALAGLQRSVLDKPEKDVKPVNAPRLRLTL